MNKKFIAGISVLAILFAGMTSSNASTKPDQLKLKHIDYYWNYGLDRLCDGSNLVYVWVGTAGVAMTVLPDSKECK